MNKNEMYQPSQEEMGRAKEIATEIEQKQEEMDKAEWMMTETQRELVEDRENMFKKWATIGKSGYLEISGNETRNVIQGIIDEHLIKLEQVEAKDAPYAFRGSIDGNDLSGENARALYKKYSEFAVREDKEKIRKAQREFGEEEADLLAQELLK